MIYAVVGTNGAVRKKSKAFFDTLPQATEYLYQEKAKELTKHLDSTSLFGEVPLVVCVMLGDTASSKEILVDNLTRMASSKTIFIIDEPFADARLGTLLEKVAKEFFNAKEQKEKETEVFLLCDAFALRDKKKAWLIFSSLRNKEQGEAIQGALWWKVKMLWGATKSGKKTAFTLKECEWFGKEILESVILSHQGERDLMVELERIILSL